MEKAIIDNLNNERVATMEKEFNLKEKRIELRDLIRDKIFEWGIKEGGDKLHFNELVDEIFSKFHNQDKEFIRRLKEYFPKEIAVKDRLFHKIIDKLSGGL